VLLELVIENYAVVDRLRVRFHSGLNLLTGETGSGKSIVVDALGLLFGSRASADVVRSGEARARVAGIFDVRNHDAVREMLEPIGAAPEDGELIVEREILSAAGRSRAFVGSRPVALGLLRDLAPLLGDIHGQHDQQLLFSRDAQRSMLDSYAGAQDLLAGLRAVFREWTSAGVELQELERSEQEKLRMLDLWQFQRGEIESADLRAGEDAELEAERKVLHNLGRIEESAGAAYAALYDSPESASALARIAAKRLDDLLRFDPGLGAVREQLKLAELALQEASYGLRDYLSGLEANPGRLEEIESRLAAMEKLKRKYGATIDEVLAFLDDVRAQMDAVEHASERMEALRACRSGHAATYERLAAELSALRHKAAAELQKQVQLELSGLAMERTVFEVRFAPAAWSEVGSESVEFLVSPNRGEEPRPLEKVASGGEISRIALALKTCLATRARTDANRTLVFDEVDTGIGGSAAEGVGRRLRQLARADQVLCVTHLPQIACFADYHYRVEKQEQKGRTRATVEELDVAARTQEVGRMLSGQKLTPEALKQAEQLIKLGTLA
jgi:DNA repair protein RecN (Recombination protein N)